MSNQNPGGPMKWHGADDTPDNAGSTPAGFDEERREEEERRRAEEEERRREEEERRRIEEEERRREEEERRRIEEEERRREEEERRQSERYESEDPNGEHEDRPAPDADEGYPSGSPFAGEGNEGVMSNLAARYGRSRPTAPETTGHDTHDRDSAEHDGPAASFDHGGDTRQPRTGNVRAANESHAVYGGGAARSLTRRLTNLARAGSQATRKLTDKVASSGTPAHRTTEARQPDADQRQAEEHAGTRPAQASPQTRKSSDHYSPTPEELESKLKLSLRETSVQRTSRIAVGSPKGGVGKSSIAYAIAGSIAYYTNMRVVLVDADPNFGSTRLLVPRPVSNSVVDLARDADELRGLSDLRSYVAQNERMRLDVALGPEHPYELAEFEDLSEAYGQIDSVLGCFYDVIVYDLGLGFRDPAIRSILSFCDQLLFVSDSEVIPNAMLKDAITYVANVGVDLSRTTLAVNHRLPATDESASTEALKTAHKSAVRQVTEIPYDPAMSQLLNQRAFHIEELSGPTRLGMLTTVAACIKGIKETVEEATSIGVPVGGVVPSNGDEHHPGRNGYGRN